MAIRYPRESVRCNNRKGDRTPAEARMPLRVKPAAPNWASLAFA